MDNWTIEKSAAIADLITFINGYRLQTVGLFACVNVAVKLDELMINPDIMVMIGSGRHQQCKPDFENDYFVGPPNFIMDYAENPKSADMKNRKEIFEKAGVLEYLLVSDNCAKVEWNRLINGKYKKIKADRDGVIKSTSLAGLWLPVKKLRSDPFAVMAAIDHGITRKEHHEQMNSIWHKN